MQQQTGSFEAFRHSMPLGNCRCLPIHLVGLFYLNWLRKAHIAARLHSPSQSLAATKCQSMKLPADAVIAAAKVRRYLLVRQTRGDKSGFLASGGYTLENADQFLHDLRTQILPLDATPLHSTEFGQFYEIRGPLVGQNDVTLQIRSIWMKEKLSGLTKFITLIPEK